ncbi:MAG: SDR family oxidoreductase [Proteobacteria bacterium]|nr:SDR family oxidoreductase [Pseudomonadota bacterium]
MQEIKKFIVIAGNGTVAKALIAQVVKESGQQLMVTTHKLSDIYQAAAQKDPGKITYCPAFDPLDEGSLVKFREAVEKFTGDDRYAVIMPIGYFVEHKPGIYHTLKENQDILNINYVAPANIMQTLIPHMLQHGGGHFVAFSCQSTQRHDPFMGAFTAAKSALESLIQTNANEYGGANKSIIFNAVRVASVKTDLTVKLKPNGDVDHYIDPEAIADVVMEVIKSRQSESRNGSIENAFKYSTTFFLDGSLRRIHSQDNKKAIDTWKSGWPEKTAYPKL